MGNTTKLTENTITIEFDGATDWVYSSITGSADIGLVVKKITFSPSANNDVMVVKNDRNGISSTSNAAEIFRVKCTADTDQREQEYGIGRMGKLMFPFIDDTDCTYSSASSVRLIIELA